ncbi:[methyl-Co(III) methanol-specific corrinoid protein]:coenzyme M methyltransferase [Anaerosolibacter carboniphilus]|uniref:[methyl-Co(III) methanol-specific corrinoid protein]:coenzyme M methyltransferase n=1 Tax=Anaerosolibacter carboniphilus TaxID=1417629 RepID=A0A841KYJ5_9FIRM|nr:uroporphyrinogen decarboxylase family protein [Anaerosolibacter carboniphilus]MBB6218551.1 [methyl-Co(III) methanol-specific corrinoid protein]:coenzyme M methyltransferase [Anaerosolibacter carboniphilus]
MTEKERLLKVLKGEAVDRPPVICPGGMMNASVTEVLADIQENHNINLDAMVEAARAVHEITGFENYGVPFDMTVESEPLGAKIDLGDKLVEPRVTKYNHHSIEDIIQNYKVNPRDAHRMGITIQAIEKLRNDEIPVIGNITGHISTATSVIDPLTALKMLKKDPDNIYRFFQFIHDYSKEYAVEMIRAGADVIAISDPTATGEILGAKNFEKFAIPFYKDMIATIHQFDIPVIIHICGNANNIIDSLNGAGVDAVSFDSIVNMRFAKSKLATRLMGNINTQLLHTGEQGKIESITQNCIDSGVDIVSPACGLSMATPVGNLRTMTDFVKRGI